MKLCQEDEVRIVIEKINNLKFGEIDNPKARSKKAKGIILETDCHKKWGWHYFVEMNKDPEQRYWFLEDEIYLI